MKYLIRSVLTYRVANEEEAKQLIEEAKRDHNFTLSKYSSEYKCKKVKGEIEEDWYRVTLTEDFTSEKEPDCTASVSYNVDPGCFPSPIVKETTDDDVEDNDYNGGVEF